MDIDLPFRGSRFIAACSKPIQTNVDKYIDISVTPDQHHRQNIKRCCVSLTEWSDTGTQVRPPAPWDRGVSSPISHVIVRIVCMSCVHVCLSLSPDLPLLEESAGHEAVRSYLVGLARCFPLRGLVVGEGLLNLRVICASLHSIKRCCDREQGVSPQASMPPRLFFIRHGEAAHNPLLVKGNFKSKEPAEINYALLSEARSIVNPSLTDKGREQALALHESLVASGEKFDLCVTTPLARAIETAQLAIGSLAAKFLVTPELCETATGPTGLKLAGPQSVTALQR